MTQQQRAALVELNDATVRLVAARTALDLAQDNNRNGMRKPVPVPWRGFFAALTAQVAASERVRDAFA